MSFWTISNTFCSSEIYTNWFSLLFIAPENRCGWSVRLSFMGDFSWIFFNVFFSHSIFFFFFWLSNTWRVWQVISFFFSILYSGEEREKMQRVECFSKSPFFCFYYYLLIHFPVFYVYTNFLFHMWYVSQVGNNNNTKNSNVLIWWMVIIFKFFVTEKNFAKYKIIIIQNKDFVFILRQLFAKDILFLNT